MIPRREGWLERSFDRDDLNLIQPNNLTGSYSPTGQTLLEATALVW